MSKQSCTLFWIVLLLVLVALYSCQAKLHSYTWGRRIPAHQTKLKNISANDGLLRGLNISQATVKEYAIVLTDEGQLYGWGINASYQLGLDSNGFRGQIFVPQPIQINTTGISGRIVQVAAAQNYVIVLTDENQLYTWGSTSVTAVPMNTSMLHGEEIVDIVAGRSHVMARTGGGKLYGFGYNAFGQLGNGNHWSVYSNFVAVDMTAMQGKKVIQVAPGDYHTMALTEDGGVYTWGAGETGSLGYGPTSLSSYFPREVNMTNILAGARVTQLAASGGFSSALTDNGRLLFWGSLEYQSYGIQSAPRYFYPEEYYLGELSTKNITSIVSGTSHLFALTDEGKLYGWGGNMFGQLCTSSLDSSEVPVATHVTEDLKSKRFISVASALTVTLTITEQGELCVCGNSDYQQLGDGQQVLIPQLSSLSFSHTQLVTSGYDTEFSLQKNGTIFAIGDNTFGQLGVSRESGRYIDHVVTVNTTGSLSGKTVTNIVPGIHHTLALTIEGELYAWGNNSHGQLGDGTTEDRYSPVRVLLNDSIAQMDTYGLSSVAVTTSGKVYIWGQDIRSDEESYDTIPTEIEALSDIEIVHVVIGEEYMDVLSVDGKVYELGHRSALVRNMSADGEVLSNKTVVQIVAGAGHSVALTDEAEVYTWNENYTGALCIPTSTVIADSPVKINFTLSEGSYIKQIAASSSSTFVLTSDNKMYGCGYNLVGQLGIGTVSMIEPISEVVMDNIQVLTNSTQLQCGLLGCTFTVHEVIFCFGFESDDREVCSGHGDCISEDTCGCYTPYYGPDCQYLPSESLEQHISDSIEHQSTMKVPSESIMHSVTNWETTSATSSAVYMTVPNSETSSGFSIVDTTLPTATSSDLNVPSMNTESSLDVAQVSSSSGSPVVTDIFCNDVLSTDANVCSGHGVCEQQDYCTCYTPYFGSNCENRDSNHVITGSLSCTPLIGRALSTKFTVTASNWENAVVYTFGYIAENNQKVYLSTKTSDSTFTAYLPAGNVTLFISAVSITGHEATSTVHVFVEEIGSDALLDTVTNLVSNLEGKEALAAISALSVTIKERNNTVNSTIVAQSVQLVVDVLYSNSSIFLGSPESSSTVISVMNELTEEPSYLSENTAERVSSIILSVLLDETISLSNNSLSQVTSTARHIETLLLQSSKPSVRAVFHSLMINLLSASSRNSEPGTRVQVNLSNSASEMVKERAQVGTVVRSEVSDPKLRSPLSTQVTGLDFASINGTVSLQVISYSASIFDNTPLASSIVSVKIFINNREIVPGRSASQESSLFETNLPVANAVHDNSTYTCRFWDEIEQGWKNDTSVCSYEYIPDRSVVSCSCSKSVTIGATLDYVQAIVEEEEESLPRQRKISPGVIAIVIIVVFTAVMFATVLIVSAAFVTYCLVMKKRAQDKSDVEMVRMKNMYSIWYSIRDLWQNIRQ